MVQPLLYVIMESTVNFSYMYVHAYCFYINLVITMKYENITDTTSNFLFFFFGILLLQIKDYFGDIDGFFNSIKNLLSLLIVNTSRIVPK